MTGCGPRDALSSASQQLGRALRCSHGSRPLVGSAKHVRAGSGALQPAAQQITLRKSRERACKAGLGRQTPLGLG